MPILWRNVFSTMFHFKSICQNNEYINNIFSFHFQQSILLLFLLDECNGTRDIFRYINDLPSIQISNIQQQKILYITGIPAKVKKKIIVRVIAHNLTTVLDVCSTYVFSFLLCQYSAIKTLGHSINDLRLDDYVDCFYLIKL